MTPTHRESEIATLFDPDQVTPTNLEDALELLAPTPQWVDGQPPSLEAVVRHTSTHFIAGTIGDEVPAVIQDPSLNEAVDPVLRSIGEIHKLLRQGWQDRHRQVQVAMRPELAKYFNDKKASSRPYYGDPIGGFRHLLVEVAIGEVKSQSWRGQAQCKDIEPERLYIEAPLGRPDKKRKEIFKQETIEITKMCRRCPVREECLDYGLRNAEPLSGYQVYGGMLLRTIRKTKRLEAINPFEY